MADRLFSALGGALLLGLAYSYGFNPVARATDFWDHLRSKPTTSERQAAFDKCVADARKRIDEVRQRVSKAKDELEVCANDHHDTGSPPTNPEDYCPKQQVKVARAKAALETAKATTCDLPS